MSSLIEWGCLQKERKSGRVRTVLPLSESENGNGQHEEEDDPSDADDVAVPDGRPGEVETTNENVAEGLHGQRLRHHVAEVTQQGNHRVHRPEDARDEAEHQLRTGAQHQSRHLVCANGRQH